MRLKRLLTLWLLAACLGGTPGWISAQDNALARAKQLLQAGNPSAAYEVLSPLQSARAGEPEYDYTLGLAALDSGRPAEALFALERVAAVQPDHNEARAAMVRAYLELGDIGTARQELNQLQQISGLERETRSIVEDYLSEIANRRGPPSPRPFRAFIALTLGYDSNVNTTTDDRSVFVPSLGSIQNLSDRNVEQNDIFGSAAAGASIRQPIQAGLDLLAGVNGTWRLNIEEDFDRANLLGHIGLSHERGDDVFQSTLRARHFRLDNDSFQNAYGAALNWRHRLDRTSDIRVYGSAYRLTYPDQEIRNANRYTLGGSYVRAFAAVFKPLGFVSAYGGTEDENASGVEHLGHDYWGLRLGGQFSVAPNTTVFGSAVYELRDYGGTDPSFLVSREDDRFAFRLGADWGFARDWLLTPEFNYLRSDSNIPTRDYDRTAVSVTVRRNF